MKTYRRVLIPMPADGRGEILLRRAADMLPSRSGELMAVQVLDTRRGFEADGPAGRLPGEHTSRRVPAAKKRLDLLLARNDLGWAESRVLYGEPRRSMLDFIRTWKPDLVVTCAHLKPEDLAWGVTDDELPDVLTVKCNSLFFRLGDAFSQAAHGQA